MITPIQQNEQEVGPLKNSECFVLFVCFFFNNFPTTSFASLTKIPLHSLKIHLPSERVLTVWGNLADFIIAVKVMISVRSSLLQPVQSPFIRRIRCFCRKTWINAWLPSDFSHLIISSAVCFSHLWYRTCLIWVFQAQQWELNQHFACCSNWQQLIPWY